MAVPGPDKPAARLDLKVGFSCNNRCVFCVQGEKRHQVGDRSLEELREILAERRSGARGIVFTGGEPTLRDDLIELVAAARELGYRPIQIQTNGRRLAYRSYVEALVEAGVTEFSPALHGSRESLHDALTRSPGAWKQVVRGIRNVRALGLPVITNTVVVQDNLADLPNIARVLAQLGVWQSQYAYVHPAGTAGANFFEVVPRFTQAMPFIYRGLDVFRAAGIRSFTEAVPFCFMRGYEQHVVEGFIPDTCVVDAPFVIEDYTEFRLKEGKAHGPPCERCTWVKVCEGPWHEYPREYGWDEFVPRDDEPTLGR